MDRKGREGRKGILVPSEESSTYYVTVIDGSYVAERTVDELEFSFASFAPFAVRASVVMNK
jgi:hypothetical protein